METHEILEKVQRGELSVSDAEQYFRKQPFEEMVYAKLDTHRKVRSGFAEVIYCSGKADQHLLHIVERLYEEEGEVFGTRASAHQYEILRERFPQIQYDELSRIIKITKEGKKLVGGIAVCTAGTADIPVAEEASQTAEYFGTKVERVYDVGVSGIHRLFAELDVIQKVNC
ncbi:MAG: AIR carboxylase family protein, partial [Blautia sp.]